jgi:hypothetical protein
MTMLALGDDTFGAGFIAFVVVVVLCIASYFLFRSMNRHLRKVPDDFDTADRPPQAGERPDVERGPQSGERR